MMRFIPGLFVVSVALGWFVQPAAAGGVIVGPLCLDGVIATAHKEQQTRDADGTWTPTDYAIDNVNQPKSHIVVFDKAIAPSNRLENCTQVTKRMHGLGAQPILAGDLDSLTLHAALFKGAGGSRVQIEADDGSGSKGLAAILGHVVTGNRPLAGGTIDFRGSRLWIHSASEILSTSSSIDGAFSIEAWNRIVKGAVIKLAGSVAYKADLAPKDNGNLTVQIDLSSGRAGLWNGELAGQPKQVADGNIALGNFTAASVRLSAQAVTVTAVAGNVDVRLSGLTGTSNAASVPGEKLAWNFGDDRISIGRMAGRAVIDDSFTLSHALISNLQVTSPAGNLDNDAGIHLITGDVTVEFESLSDSDLIAQSHWTKADFAPLGSILPSGTIDRLDFNEAGPRSTPMVSGRVDGHMISLGAIALSNPVRLQIPRLLLGATLSIPIHIDVPAASGSITIADGKQTAVLQGHLDTLYLDGSLSLNIASPDQSSLLIPKDHLKIGIGGAVAVSPMLAGAKPNFAGATVGLSSFTDLSIAKTSRGKALLTASTFLIGEPVIQVGEDGTARPAKITLAAAGGGKILFDLETNKMVLAQATLTADNTQFELEGDSPRIIDLNGERITDPLVSIGNLKLEIDELGPVKIERGTMTALSIGAARVERHRKPGETSGLDYSGTLPQPMTVASIGVGRLVVGDEIKFSELVLKEFNLAVAAPTIDFGSGVQYNDAVLHVHADGLKSVSTPAGDESAFSRAHLDLNGKIAIKTSDFMINGSVGSHLNVDVDGPVSALTGVGALEIGAFSGDARGTMKVGFACKDTGHLDVPVEYNFGVGGAKLDATVNAGHFSAKGAVGPIGLVMHTLSGSECSTEVMSHVVQAQGKYWTDGICNRGWEIYSCRWESPEISYAYHFHLAVHFAALTAGMTNPHIYFDGGNTAVCNVGLIQVDPSVVLGVYTPGIDSPYPGLDGIVNALISATLEPVESVVGTGITNGAGWLVSGIASGAGNTLCIGRPL